MFYLIDKNRAQIGNWLIWVDRTTSVKETAHLISEYSRRREQGEGIKFGIWFDYKLIGYCSYAHIHQESKIASLAYWLDRDYQGKGIATRSCAILIDYAFKHLQLSRVEINCAEGNEKSMGIPLRLGFKQERIDKQSEQIRGGLLVDNHCFALLKQQWHNTPQYSVSEIG